MEILIIAVYAALLGLVAPYILGSSTTYGALMPFGLAAVSGSALWLVLTWVGLHYDQAWIWFAVMLAMPAAVWVGTKVISKRRLEAEANELAAIRSR